jgi:hypothetical protein
MTLTEKAEGTKETEEATVLITILGQTEKGIKPILKDTRTKSEKKNEGKNTGRKKGPKKKDRNADNMNDIWNSNRKRKSITKM